MIFSGRSRCPICERVIQRGDDVFATSGCAFPAEHPLFRYCDAGIHWECFAAWPERPAFAKGYVENAVRFEPKDPHWARVHLDDLVFVCVNPLSVRVHFLATSHSHPFPLYQWPEPPQHDWHELERRDWEKAASQLAALYPRGEDLLARVDWAAKVELARVQAEAEEQRKLAARQQLEAYNARVDLLQWEPCPHCGADGPMRYLDRRGAGTGNKSCFICQTCSRSAHMEDFRS